MSDQRLPFYGVSNVRLIFGDNRRTLPSLADNSIDAVVTDPPYGLGKEPDMTEVLRHWLAGDDFAATGGGFMGHTWDSFVLGPATWKEVHRVLKPGGHVVMFSGTRTWDMATLALRLAGFEIRDGLMWLHGSGFPKSLNVSRAIDKAAGLERAGLGGSGDPVKESDITAPASPEAEQWEGWGTALKPAWEPIVLARKPISSTVVANLLQHGTGALNIDASRVGSEARPVMVRNETVVAATSMENPTTGASGNGETTTLGRFPANLILSHTEDCQQVGYREVRTGTAVLRNGGGQTIFGGIAKGKNTAGSRADAGFGKDDKETIPAYECAPGCPVASVDEQSGVSRAGAGSIVDKGSRNGFSLNASNDGSLSSAGVRQRHDDQGGASRFFYSAKVSKAERNAGMPDGEKNDHPTVKPIALMEYLVRLVTPPGGVVLDPCCGSGSTGIAAANYGFGFVGLDDNSRAIAISKHRISHAGADVTVVGDCDF